MESNRIQCYLFSFGLKRLEKWDPDLLIILMVSTFIVIRDGILPGKTPHVGKNKSR